MASKEHWELGFLSAFVAIWIVALASLIGLLPSAGLLELSLYQLYGVAAALGWLAGNVYVGRTRTLPKAIRYRLLLVYLLGPPGAIYLLRALAPKAVQAEAPLAAVYACGVFLIFFLVPVTLKGSAVRPPRD